ncbi:MAG: DUF2135 domain-containing protein [Deltaproteobacteria bacterium]|nr:DUF2135 domain-containing protein [Deltaproteobacteria bacterium]
MRTACVLGIAGLLWLTASAVAGPTEAPTVEIDEPVGGWSTERIVEVSGSVSGASVARAIMVVNGYERWLDLKGNRFQATIVVSKGANSIEVVARNDAGEGRDSVSVFSDVPPVDMQVILSWDTDGTDVDMHVTDPAGEECFYSHRTTEMGGRLDVDDTDGYGPEVFTLTHAQTGEYLVEVKYFSSHGHPQTRCRLQVVLFEGTGREKRLEFHKILTKTGDKVEVGRFQVAPPQEGEEQP